MKKCGEVIDRKGCGAKLEIKETPNMIHKAKVSCPECGFRGFQAKEKNKGKKRRSKITPKNVFEYHNHKTERCFFCRRKKDELGRNETFTVDHIHELSHGGEDEVENTQVLCTACHKLKNHQRLYHNRHQTSTTQEIRR